MMTKMMTNPEINVLIQSKKPTVAGFLQYEILS